MKTALIITSLLEIIYLGLSFYLAELFGQWSYQGEIARTLLRIISIVILLYCYRRFFCLGGSTVKRERLLHPGFIIAALLLLAFAVLFTNVEHETFVWQYVFATSGILAGFREELFYRGIIQKTLQGKLHYRPALTIGCTVFTASHIQYIYHAQIYAVMLITLAGVIFGSLYLYSGSVFAVGLIHGLYDALLSIQLVSVRLSSQTALIMLLSITLISLVLIASKSSSQCDDIEDTDTGSNPLSMP